MSRFASLLENTRRARKRWFESAKLRLILKGFTQHWAIRISALLIALGSWAYIQFAYNSMSDTLSIPLKITVKGDFQAQAFTNGVPITHITLDIKCSPRDRANLRDNDYVVDVNLSSEKSSNIIPSYTLDEKQNIKYQGPDDAGRYDIMNIEPKQIRIIIDETRRRQITVVPILEGQPKEGYEVTKTTVTPTVIMVEGPARIIDPLESIPTEPISIEGLSKSLESEYRLVTGNPNITVLYQSRVNVMVGINTKPIRRIFKNISVEPMGTAAGDAEVTLSPTVIEVELEANRDIIDLIMGSEILAFVDVRNLPAAKYTLPVKVIDPPNCKVTRKNPDTISVSIGAFTE